MKITATEEYGLRCLVLLAKHGPGEPLTLADIGNGEGLSQPYAAKIMNLLRQEGLVDSIRGRHGGYILAYPPNRIRLSDAFSAMGEPLFGSSHCDRYGSPSSDEGCVHRDDCTVRDVWAGMNTLINAMFDRITLADLLVASDGSRLNIIALAKQHLESQTKDTTN
ncbi:HTH-type transcriptional regulator CymR [bacterium BMS3Bbin04]|nr:HTH-type transcriptional regulator CymR [bacterium BMS3Bbin04]